MQASARLSSSAASKRVIAGVSSTFTRSCYRTSRGKAHAAPLSAPEPPSKGRERITKEERRARIAVLVDNFRASNDGKFPTIKSVRKQVGGSHYTVREILQELEYNHSKLPLGNAKAGPLQGTVEDAERSSPTDEAKVAQLQGANEVAEHSRPKDEAKMARFQGESEFAEHSRPTDEAKVSPLQETNEGPEHSRPKDEAKVAQLQGETEFAEHSRPEDDSGKNPNNCNNFKSSQEIPNVDGILILQKDAATRTGTVEKTETWRYVGSSSYNVETEAAKHDMDTSETCKTADDPTLSDQTESETMKVQTNKPSVSIRVDPGKQQMEREANKLDLKDTGEPLNASEASVSDQSASDKVIEANTHDREHNPRHEPEESVNTGLFGSLKSFANGIKNFWRKL